MRVIEKLEQLTKQSIKSNLIVRERFTPEQFGSAYNAFRGTALGLAHTFWQSLWWRPSNQSRKVSGLFYAGQYTYPGVGVPMALISAQIVAKKIGKVTQDTNSIFKKGSTTYYYSSLFFRGQVKKDVFTLYAYVRVIDDYVDQVVPDVAQFEDLWKETQKEWKDKTSHVQLIKDFVALAKRKNFDLKWIKAFWKAMRQDLTKKLYSYDELEEYMYGSAEVIGLMMARIMDLPKDADQTARLQGKAMQLANFIRDVAEDESLGRNYLGYSRAERDDPRKWAAFLRKYIEKHQQIQAEANSGHHFLPRKYKIPIKTAAHMYDWTLQKISDSPGLVWKSKLKPKKIELFWKQ
jgi:phytoene synthase